MPLSEETQEILERWWQETEGKAGRVGLALLGVDENSPALSEISNSRLGSVLEGGLELTEAGIAEAKNITRRHLLAERLLVDVLGTGAGLVEERACRLEHALLDGVDESICRLLGHPKECPHGIPIPPGECCKAQERSGGRAISPLSGMGVGDTGKVAYLQSTKPDQMKKLMAMGVLPGRPIALEQRFPSYVFRSGQSEFAVDATLAGAIYVRLEPGEGREKKGPRGRERKFWRFRWGRLGHR
jgi:DtxR family Mn-dependent transcriptional regulator